MAEPRQKKNSESWKHAAKYDTFPHWLAREKKTHHNDWFNYQKVANWLHIDRHFKLLLCQSTQRKKKGLNSVRTEKHVDLETKSGFYIFWFGRKWVKVILDHLRNVTSSNASALGLLSFFFLCLLLFAQRWTKGRCNKIRMEFKQPYMPKTLEIGIAIGRNECEWESKRIDSTCSPNQIQLIQLFSAKVCGFKFLTFFSLSLCLRSQRTKIQCSKLMTKLVLTKYFVHLAFKMHC